MKISIKTLQGKQLPLEVEDTHTVRQRVNHKIEQLKAQIEKEHGFKADQQKLIAYGKVMDDNAKTLKDYSIKEGDFLVVMIAKVR